MANGNPFYVQQGPGYAPALIGLAGRIDEENKKREELAKVQKEQQRVQAMKDAVIAAYDSGDPDQLARVSLQHPEMAQQIRAASKFKDEVTEKDYMDTLIDIYLNPTEENVKERIEKRKALLKEKGVSPEMSKETDSFLEKFRTDKDAVRKEVALELSLRYPKRWLEAQEALNAGKKDVEEPELYSERAKLNYELKNGLISQAQYDERKTAIEAKEKKEGYIKSEGSEAKDERTNAEKNFDKYTKLLSADAEKAQLFGNQIGLFGKQIVPTDMDDFVADAKKAYKDSHNGEEMPANLVNEARLQYKRAQAAEVSATTQAKKEVEYKFAEKISNAAKTGAMLAEISQTPALIEAKGEITPVASKEEASNRISGTLSEMAGIYLTLDSKDAVINADKDVITNVTARLGASGVGQFLANAVGTDAQTLRTQIKNNQPLLINYIRQASEMGSRGLDSEKELAFYLQAASDPTREFHSNLAALAILDEAYGTGEVSDTIKSTIPSKVLISLRRQGRELGASDKLPTGIPEGSKKLNRTSGGKPVYQAPDGSYYVEE